MVAIDPAGFARSCEYYNEDLVTVFLPKKVFPLNSVVTIAASNGIRGNVLAAVSQERDRQNEKWGEQNHADPIWMAIHGEEFGEINKAILESMFSGADPANIETELIQLAATCVSHLECIARRRALPIAVSLSPEAEACSEAFRALEKITKLIGGEGK